MDPTDLAFAGIARQAELIAAGEISSRELVELYLDRIARSPVMGIDYGLVRKAAELSARHTFSMWDALVIVAAARSGAEILYSEDLQHGRRILGLEIINPFVVY